MFITSTEISTDSDLCQCELSYALSAYHDGCYEEQGVSFRSQLSNAVAKRKADFLAGRCAAKLALEQLTQSQHTPFHLAVGDHREPLWPSGIIGSITHTGDQACALVARADRYRAIGVDTENLLSGQKFSELSNVILTQSEKDKLSTEALNDGLYGTLVFSAKEALFKALFPYVGQYFDFKDADVVDVNYQCDQLVVQINRTLGTHELLRSGRCYSIDFEYDTKSVTTRLVLEAY